MELRALKDGVPVIQAELENEWRAAETRAVRARIDATKRSLGTKHLSDSTVIAMPDDPDVTITVGDYVARGIAEADQAERTADRRALRAGVSDEQRQEVRAAYLIDDRIPTLEAQYLQSQAQLAIAEDDLADLDGDDSEDTRRSRSVIEGRVAALTLGQEAVEQAHIFAVALLDTIYERYPAIRDRHFEAGARVPAGAGPVDEGAELRSVTLDEAKAALVDGAPA